MLDIHCIYQNTIALHSCDHQFLVIGEEIGRAQQYADEMDLIVRYDTSIYEYGHITIRNHHHYLELTHHDSTIIYDKGIATASTLPEDVSVLLVDLSLDYGNIIPLLHHMQPQHIVIMPTVDQETAIRAASEIMRE
jgi:hypothetical protein